MELKKITCFSETQRREKTLSSDVTTLMQTLQGVDGKLEIERRKYEVVLGEGKRYEAEAVQLRQRVGQVEEQRRETEEDVEQLKATEFRLRTQVCELVPFLAPPPKT